MRGLFNRFVQVGRVAVINYGPDYGKLCVIVDIIDHNRVLIDGPVTITGVPRQPFHVKRIALTKLRVPIPKAARLKTLTKAFKDNKILQKWNNTAWAKKIIARHNKDNLTDFERFVVMVAKTKKNRVISKTITTMLKKKKKTIKLKRQASKLQKEGKPLSKKLKRAIHKSKDQLEVLKKKKEHKAQKAKAKKEAKAKGDKAKKPTEQPKTGRKPKPTPKKSLVTLARLRTKKMHQALLKHAAAQHERNVKRRKRLAEKKKSTDTAKKEEKPKDTVKKLKSKKAAKSATKAAKEAPKAAKVAPKAKAAAKQAPKAKRPVATKT